MSGGRPGEGGVVGLMYERGRTKAGMARRRDGTSSAGRQMGATIVRGGVVVVEGGVGVVADDDERGGVVDGAVVVVEVSVGDCDVEPLSIVVLR